MDTVTVRAAVVEDLEAINNINNYFIVNTVSTLDVEPMTMDQRRKWFTKFGTTGRHRLLVACVEDNKAVGYACSGKWRMKAGCDASVETSVYVLPEYNGRGIGKKLYKALFEMLEREDVHRAYGGLTMPNEASVKLHEKFGFYRIAFFSEQGRKFGQYRDVAWFEKPL